MTTPRLFAVDLDGTLLTDTKTYNHEQLDRVLELMAAEGSHLAIATGNQMPKVDEYLAGHEHHANLHYIAENGAIIHNQGRDLALWGFSPQLVHGTLEALHQHPEIGIIVSCRHHSYIPADRLDIISAIVHSHLSATGMEIPGCDPADPLSVVRPFYPNVETIDDVEAITDTVVKIALNTDSSADVYKTMSMLEETLPKGITPTSSGFGAIDLILTGNHKGRGLAWLANHLSIPQSQTIAYGDSGNDLEMFQYAATAIAMEESDPRLLPEADFSIGSNQDGAVLDHIEATLTAP